MRLPASEITRRFLTPCLPACTASSTSESSPTAPGSTPLRPPATPSAAPAPKPRKPAARPARHAPASAAAWLSCSIPDPSRAQVSYWTESTASSRPAHRHNPHLVRHEQDTLRQGLTAMYSRRNNTLVARIPYQIPGTPPRLVSAPSTCRPRGRNPPLVPDWLLATAMRASPVHPPSPTK